MKAQTILDESQEPEWTAEDFMRLMSNNPGEEKVTSRISKMHLSPSFDSPGDDIQFKFNYQRDKTKSVFEELDIPVY